LSDARTPTDGSVTDAKIVAGGLSTTAITGTAVVTNDVRLTDQRTPLDNSVTSAKIVDGTIVNADVSATAAVEFSKLENGSGLSVLGRSANSSGAVASIAAGSNHGVLRRDGSVLGFGTVDAQGLSNDSVTSAKIEDGAVTSAKIANGAIVDADVNATAAIAQSKIANLTTDLGGKLPTTLTTKGDLITRSASAPDRLPVGTNGYVLTADSDATLGIKWAVAAAPVDDPFPTAMFLGGM
jgi:hypothetical protein